MQVNAPTPRVARGGLDLGGTNIDAVIVDARSNVLASARRATPVEGGPLAVAAQMAGALNEAAKSAGLEPGELRGVGVGSPGIVDTATGVVSSARNLPDWEGKFELGSTLADELGTEVFVGNDVQVATEGEFKLGAARP